MSRLREALAHGKDARGAFPGHDTMPADRQRLFESLQRVLKAIRATDLRALSVGRFEARIDSGGAERLRHLVQSLSRSARALAPFQLGATKCHVIQRLLGTPAPDFLALFDRQTDENAHSDVLRWLLDPAMAPTIAPAALNALFSRFGDAEDWRRRLAAALSEQGVSVRREVLMGRESSDPDAADRIDLLISGPDFVLAVENKIFSPEHDKQTHTYWRWLEALPASTLRAGILLTPTGFPASCPMFRPLSYVELLGFLLEAPSVGPTCTAEDAVLSGYVKALGAGVLRRELRGLRPGQESP